MAVISNGDRTLEVVNFKEIDEATAGRSSSLTTFPQMQRLGSIHKDSIWVLEFNVSYTLSYASFLSLVQWSCSANYYLGLILGQTLDQAWILTHLIYTKPYGVNIPYGIHFTIEENKIQGEKPNNMKKYFRPSIPTWDSFVLKSIMCHHIIYCLFMNCIVGHNIPS